MNHKFEIHFQNTEGALLRVLGTIERRGFALSQLQVEPEAATGFAARLNADGSRDPALLCRQLERLIDVQSARVLFDFQPASEEAFQATWLQ